ncbi:MAG: hypothetical protein WBA22_01130 [Candidatus Methanofastidiosia archaeon]
MAIRKRRALSEDTYTIMGNMGFLLTFLSKRFLYLHNGLFAHRGIRSLVAVNDREDGIKEKLYKGGGVSNHGRFL